MNALSPLNRHGLALISLSVESNRNLSLTSATTASVSSIMAPNAPYASSSPVIPFCDTGALILNCANGKRLAIGRTYLASLSVDDAVSLLTRLSAMRRID